MSIPVEMLRRSPGEFVADLQSRGIRRFFFVFDPHTRRVMASHDHMQSVAEFLQADRRDFDGHEGLFYQLNRAGDVLMSAVVHRTVRGQGAGGVRFRHYDTVESYLRDGLRLARGMTRKNALARLWWGGGKGVMARLSDSAAADPEARAELYREYGAFISSLRGCYVTAEDVGTTVDDMANVFSRTRFTTCIPERFGGSGNPSVPTARGVVVGMEAALEHAGLGGLRGKSVAIQGMGNVGAPLIGFLFEKGVARIVASDVRRERVEEVARMFAGKPLEARVAAEGDNAILAEACDIVSPCAFGASLNPQSIPTIRARIVCGAANNQLEDEERDALLLHRRDILYVPDFLVNRMGIVNCADEQYGRLPGDPAFERHLSRDWEGSIFRTALAVLAESRANNLPTATIALRLADKLSMEPHPISGHRGRSIIDSLVADRWHEEE